MAETHEWMFYEVTWRQWARGNYPLPWWCRQYFRAWSDDYDGGLFSSKEAAFCSNAHYRYWHMIGVKDHHQESLIGQAGESVVMSNCQPARPARRFATRSGTANLGVWERQGYRSQLYK
ncbi:MAG: hypothetical protein U1F76_09310 [Candidatus Competibacteraceae bacterium]